MTKAQYDKLFTKATKFYNDNQSLSSIREAKGYLKFKAACDQLISTSHNDIESTDSYRYSKLNALFAAPSLDELIAEEW